LPTIFSEELFAPMDETLAHKRLTEVLELIDQFGDLYDKRWGGLGGLVEQPQLDSQLKALHDKVRARTKFAQGVIAALGDDSLTTRVVEHEEGTYGPHPFTQARVAIVEAIAILAQREELAEIVGPVGPRLSASELHHVIWGAAAGLWDDGHFHQAVQTAASALEGLLQGKGGTSASGQDLGAIFSLSDPKQGSPRMRLRDVDPHSQTGKSAHEGAASLVRGAFAGVRNLVSHPGWPDPTADEALEMLAVLSYVARLIDRSDVAKAK
jgi:hypothetical protein